MHGLLQISRWIVTIQQMKSKGNRYSSWQAKMMLELQFVMIEYLPDKIKTEMPLYIAPKAHREITNRCLFINPTSGRPLLPFMFAHTLPQCDR